MLDFDSAAPGELLTADYVEGGMRMSPVTGHYDFMDGLAQIDTFGGGGRSTVQLDMWGESFDFLSFLVELWAPYPDQLPLDEYAYLISSNGGYAAITGAGLMSFSGPLWTGVSWIQLSVVDPNYGAGDFRQDNLQFDNVRYGVPEPWTVLLMASGVLPLVLAVPRRARLQHLGLRSHR
jgi:hypothetical protein